ncbi:substrate-binding domain-containing protein [Paraoerskovia sediminicola]
MAFNDLVATGLLRRLRARGITVPDDLSVVGFDDTFVAALTQPPLTTCRADLRGMGSRAVDLLGGLLSARRTASRPAGDAPAGGGVPRQDLHHEHVELAVELVVRDSTTDAPERSPR